MSGSMAPRFVCDVMLGRTAKWLRLLGYDTEYFRLINDEDLINFAGRQKRILLTRDSLLMERRPIRRGQVLALLVGSDSYIEQLRQAVADFDLNTDQEARCAVCNLKLNQVPKASIKGRVPAYVFRTQSDFRSCPRCARIYWPATHWQKILAVKKELKADRSA